MAACEEWKRHSYSTIIISAVDRSRHAPHDISPRGDLDLAPLLACACVGWCARPSDMAHSRMAGTQRGKDIDRSDVARFFRRPFDCWPPYPGRYSAREGG